MTHKSVSLALLSGELNLRSGNHVDFDVTVGQGGADGYPAGGTPKRNMGLRVTHMRMEDGQEDELRKKKDDIDLSKLKKIILLDSFYLPKINEFSCFVQTYSNVSGGGGVETK